MSSSIDWFDCPKCGGSASRDQDNRTSEVHVSCRCGWKGEEVGEGDVRPAQYVKTVVGFVDQTFELVNGKYVCTSQEFTAGDEVSRQEENGNPVDMDGWEEDEVYQNMYMVQPD